MVVADGGQALPDVRICSTWHISGLVTSFLVCGATDEARAEAATLSWSWAHGCEDVT